MVPHVHDLFSSEDESSEPQARGQHAHSEGHVDELQRRLSHLLRDVKKDGGVELVIEPLVDDAPGMQLVNHTIQVVLPGTVLPGGCTLVHGTWDIFTSNMEHIYI